MFLLGLGVEFAANGAYATWAVNSSQHKWCGTLTLLTAQPPPKGNPDTNPSRAYDQRLAGDFQTLKAQLGC